MIEGKFEGKEMSPTISAILERDDLVAFLDKAGLKLVCMKNEKGKPFYQVAKAGTKASDFGEGFEDVVGEEALLSAFDFVTGHDALFFIIKDDKRPNYLKILGKNRAWPQPKSDGSKKAKPKKAAKAKGKKGKAS